RRRHTRSKRDWSSDVCSSDLSLVASSGADTTTRQSGCTLINTLLVAFGRSTRSKVMRSSPYLKLIGWLADLIKTFITLHHTQANTSDLHHHLDNFLGLIHPTTNSFALLEHQRQ